MSQILIPTRADQSIFPPSEFISTPPQFDNGQSLVNSAFVQRALGNFNATVKIGAAQTGTVFTALNSGNLIEYNSGATPTTTTMPLLSALPDGGSMTFSSISSGLTTVNRNGASDVFWGNNLAGATSFTLNNGETATWVKTSTDNIWILASSNVNFFGLPQVLTNVTGSRTLATPVTNSTGRQIEANIVLQLGPGQVANILKGGNSVLSVGNNMTVNTNFSFTVLVPNLQSYSATTSGGSIFSWWETR